MKANKENLKILKKKLSDLYLIEIKLEKERTKKGLSEELRIKIQDFEKKIVNTLSSVKCPYCGKKLSIVAYNSWASSCQVPDVFLACVTYNEDKYISSCFDYKTEIYRYYRKFTKLFPINKQI